MYHPYIALRNFAYSHDDLPAFHASYFVLTFTLAILLNLGAFGVLVLAHMALDIVKYRGYMHCSWRETLEGTVRESLIDVTLLAVGFVFSVYLHHSLSIGSISVLLRTEFAFIRSIAMLAPKIKILHHTLKIISHIHHYLQQAHPHFRKGWTGIDVFCFAVIGVCGVLLVQAPYILQVPSSAVEALLLDQVLPWRV